MICELRWTPSPSANVTQQWVKIIDIDTGAELVNSKLPPEMNSGTFKCEEGQRLRITLAAIRGVDEAEAAIVFIAPEGPAPQPILLPPSAIEVIPYQDEVTTRETLKDS